MKKFILKENQRRVKVYCNLPVNHGTCRALIPMYFYNNDSGKCEFFYYGGCGGNSNKFYKKVECEEICVNDASSSLNNSIFSKVFVLTFTFFLVINIK